MTLNNQEDHDLFSAIDGGTPASMALDFRDFDRANPAVWDMFVAFAFDLINAGCKTLSASLITERIRRETAIVTRGGEFKINNNFRAFYARKFMRTFPAYGEIFRTRKAEADHAD